MGGNPAGRESRNKRQGNKWKQPAPFGKQEKTRKKMTGLLTRNSQYSVYKRIQVEEIPCRQSR